MGTYCIESDAKSADWLFRECRPKSTQIKSEDRSRRAIRKAMKRAKAWSDENERSVRIETSHGSDA